MPNRDERQKASDVFRDSNFLMGSKVSFDEAFPKIQDLTVVVKERGHGIRGIKERVFRKENIGEYIDCSNPLCYNGGFSIVRILREMVHNQQTTLSLPQDCKGYEGSPKGRRKYRNCPNTFDVTVSITYRD